MAKETAKEKEKEKDTSRGDLEISLSDNEMGGDDTLARTELSHPLSPTPQSSMSFFESRAEGSPNQRNNSSSSSNAEVDEDEVTQKIKLVVVGEHMQGHKTQLLDRYVHRIYPGDYARRDFTYYHKHKLDNGAVVDACLLDTTDQEELSGIRGTFYPCTDGIVFLYSVSDPDSYESIRDKWFPEIRNHCPDAQRILVGCETETRNDPAVLQKLEQKGLEPITSEMGKALAKEIGAVAFFECSLAADKGIREALDYTIQSVVQRLPVIPLIKELRQYAKKRAAEGDGFRFFWEDAFGGKSCADKVQSATNLADDLNEHGIGLQREYPQDELDTVLEGTLGGKVKKYPEVVASLKRNLRVEPVVESNVQPAGRRPSH